MGGGGGAHNKVSVNLSPPTITGLVSTAVVTRERPHREFVLDSTRMHTRSSGKEPGSPGPDFLGGLSVPKQTN